MINLQRLAALLCIAASATLFDAARPNIAHAQEIQITGPLAGQPAVRRMRLYRNLRIQLEPNFTFTLTDEYKRALLAGLHAGFYFTDWLGVGAWFGYSVANLNTDLTNEIEAQGVSTERNRLSLPSRQGFANQVGIIQWMASAQLEFVPLRGKLALFQKLFLNTDFYIFVGAGIVGLEERADTTRVEAQAACAPAGGGGLNPGCVPYQSQRATRVTASVTFGAGLSMYFNDFVGLNINWRAIPFAWNTGGTDESSEGNGDFPDGRIDANDRFLRLNHMFTVGIVIYLPTSPHITD